MKDYITLWQQSAITLGDSTLSHNGLTIERDNESYQKLFHSIFDEERGDTTLFKSERIQIYKRGDSYLVFSNCEEKDENERKIAFAARIKAQHKSHIIKILQKELSLTNKTISQETQTIIQAALYRYEIITICVILVIISCLIIKSFAK